MDWLRSYRPDLVERYEELYARGAYLPRVEQERIGALVRRARAAARTTSVGAFRREPGRDYEAMRPRNPAHRAATAGAGGRADDAVLIAPMARRRSVTTVTAWSRYRPGRVVLSLYVGVHHDLAHDA